MHWKGFRGRATGLMMIGGRVTISRVAGSDGYVESGYSDGDSGSSSMGVSGSSSVIVSSSRASSDVYSSSVDYISPSPSSSTTAVSSAMTSSS